MASKNFPIEDESDDSAESPTQLDREEARINSEMRKLEAKKTLIKAKKEQKYRAFLANTKMPKEATPGSGGCSGGSSSDSDKSKKRKAAVHDLREKFATRTTLGKAPNWHGRTPSPKASPIRPIRLKKPSPVHAPAPNKAVKAAPVVKGVKEAKVDPDKAFIAASRSVAKTVSSMIRQDGYKVGDKSPSFGFPGKKPPTKTPGSLPHELNRIEALLLPEKLQLSEWNDVWKKWDGPTNMEENIPLTEENIPLTDFMKTVYEGLCSAHDKMGLLKDILLLHSVSNVHLLQASFVTRLFCVAQAPEKEAITSKLVMSLRSVILASDPELKLLPFREPDVLTDFFTSNSRVVKLGLFLLHHVEYGKGYNKTVINVLLSTEMQNRVY